MGDQCFKVDVLDIFFAMFFVFVFVLGKFSFNVFWGQLYFFIFFTLLGGGFYPLDKMKNWI